MYTRHYLFRPLENAVTPSLILQILPQATILKLLWLEDFRAWVFGLVELQQHPFQVRRVKARRRVQQLEVYMVGQLLCDVQNPILE